MFFSWVCSDWTVHNAFCILMVHVQHLKETCHENSLINLTCLPSTALTEQNSELCHHYVENVAVLVHLLIWLCLGLSVAHYYHFSVSKSPTRWYPSDWRCLLFTINKKLCHNCTLYCLAVGVHYQEFIKVINLHIQLIGNTLLFMNWPILCILMSLPVQL